MKKFLPIILVILLGFTLRVHRIAEVPPGLTHDEANHGRDSINVLDGVLLFYFPLNYGSEPLYNYAVAGSMALVGENLFALRLVNIFAGALTIASLYLWADWAFGKRTALVAAALIAVSFWPLAVSRQALRAGMLPFLGTLAVIFFWQIFRNASKQASNELEHHGEGALADAIPRRRPFPLAAVAGFALSVALTLHTYLAARSLWLVFPIFLGYLAFVHRSIFRRVWLPALAGLAAAGLMVVPMFAYVRAHPEAETRLEMLEGPLQGLLSGDLGPIFGNIGEALLAFVWPGFGDHFLAYNIPGRPVFDILTAIFFLLGILFSLLKWRRPGYAFLLIWFGAGIIPSLITGPEANTTRNMGALPAAYLLAAVGFVEAGKRLLAYRPAIVRPALIVLLAIWLSLVGSGSYNDYFVRWSQSPDVRAAYQRTLIEALTFVENVVEGPIVVSSVYPGAAHDPSIARVLLPSGNQEMRWIDARQAMIFPNGAASPLVVPSSAPLHPAFFEMVEEVEVATLRPDDLDPSFTLYQLLDDRASQANQGANFGDALTLLEARWLGAPVRPGETVELLTMWRVTDPARVGPLVPPAFETDVILFTHVLDAGGEILAQRDALDAPSWAWQAGDVFIQIHTLTIPPEATPGLRETVVGVYDRLSGDRLHVIGSDGQSAGTTAAVTSLRLYE